MDIKPWEYADFPSLQRAGPRSDACPHHRGRDRRDIPCMVRTRQGSAWMKQDRTALVPTLSRIAERGFVVAIVEYRHSGIASFPAHIEDARNAVRFMRANAAQHHADADNLFLSGCRVGWSGRGRPAVVAHAADGTGHGRRRRWLCRRPTPPTCRMRRGA